MCSDKTKKDRGGVFGMSCDHMLLHLASTLKKGETWRAPTTLVKKLLINGVCPAAVLFDINCVYGPYFLRWLAKQVGLPESTVEAALQMQFPLPPFHVNMHQASCRAKCALTNPQFADWILPPGEPPEQLWSQLGPGHTVKYMTLHGGKLYLDRHICFLNGRADTGLAKRLVAQLQKLQRRGAKYEAEIQAAQRIAGVTDNAAPLEQVCLRTLDLQPYE